MLWTLTSSGMKTGKGWDVAQDRIGGKLVMLDTRIRPVLLLACSNINSGFGGIFVVLNVECKHWTCSLPLPWPAAWWAERLAMLQTFLSYL